MQSVALKASVVSAEQPENAELPIVVTAAGISMEVSFVLFRKAYSPIEVSVAGNVTLSISLPL